MNEVVEASIASASLAAGAAIWLLAGYLIQRLPSEIQNRPTLSLQHH